MTGQELAEGISGGGGVGMGVFDDYLSASFCADMI